jgi:hypothetical protein
MRRYTRLSNGFSRKLENHAAATALNYFAYNFIKIHRTLRTSPAMAAGVTDRLWSVEDLVALWESLRTAEGGKSGVNKSAGAFRLPLSNIYTNRSCPNCASSQSPKVPLFLPRGFMDARSEEHLEGEAEQKFGQSLALLLPVAIIFQSSPLPAGWGSGLLWRTVQFAYLRNDRHPERSRLFRRSEQPALREAEGISPA